MLVALAAIFYLAPWPIVYVPALLALFAFSWLRLDLAVLLVILFAPLYMHPKHIGSKEFAPSEIFVLLDAAIAAGWVLFPVRRRRLAWTRLVRSPFLLPALLFFLAATGSTLAAADLHQALQAYRERIVEPLAFFALLLLTQTSGRRWKSALGTLILAGLIVTVIGLFQRITHTDLTHDPGSTILKIHSVYGSPDNVGLLLDRVVPLWLAVLLGVSLRRLLRIGWYLVGLILLTGLFLTYSRGAWVAIALACLLLLALTRQWGRWVAAVCLVLLILAGAVRGPALVRALSIGHSGTAQTRLYIWQSAEHMIADHPFLGIGPDNFLHYYAPRPAPNQYFLSFCKNGLGYIDPRAGNQPCESHPHDEVLDFWLSTGLLGLAAFIWLEVVFWSICLRSYRAGRSQWDRVLVLGAGGAMLASLIHGLVDNSYFLIDLALLFWLLCACVSYLERSAPGIGQQSSQEVSPAPAPA